MKNSEKAELKADVRELSKKGYSKKEGVKTLVEWGYTYSTARTYWDVFAKSENQEKPSKVISNKEDCEEFLKSENNESQEKLKSNQSSGGELGVGLRPIPDNTLSENQENHSQHPKEFASQGEEETNTLKGEANSLEETPTEDEVCGITSRNSSADTIQSKVIILDDNELSMAKYAEEYPKNFKEMCDANQKETGVKKIPTHKEFQKAIDKSGLRGYQFEELEETEVKDEK